MLRTSAGAGGQSGLEYDLDGAVLLFLEDLVRMRGPVERQHVGGEVIDAERVVVAIPP